jgi:hypothetical protein
MFDSRRVPGRAERHSSTTPSVSRVVRRGVSPHPLLGSVSSSRMHEECAIWLPAKGP